MVLLLLLLCLCNELGCPGNVVLCTNTEKTNCLCFEELRIYTFHSGILVPLQSDMGFVY